ncbi:hypothetical protein DPMN_012600 [Dreissena polymorpha]|nr:hypothetical protein DPMN_012600 [Dreissena polymorpha]
MDYEVPLYRFFLIAIVLSFALSGASSDFNRMHVKLEYDKNSNTVYVKSPESKLLLSGRPFETRVDCIEGPLTCILRFSSVLEVSEASGECGKISLRPVKPGVIVGICLDLSKGLWYGGSELQYQRWPFKNITLPWQPYVTNDIVPLNQSVGNVIERHWLSSNGVGVFIPATSPLYFKHMTGESGSFSEMCFIAASMRHMTGFMKTVAPDLVLNVCKMVNILETHRHMSKEYFDLPIGQPDALMFKSPIWSTWAKFKVDINQGKVLQFADEIGKHGFSHSQLEIDDMFSSFYGEFDFSPHKFPDAKNMIRELKMKGFRVTVWVTPFANVESLAF